MNRAYSVTEINQYIKNMFVRDLVLSHVYVKGEISNCKYHSSGHIYFTLKDTGGQLACVMFAGQRKGLKFRLEEGQSVIILGSITVYERDGKYQLYANEILLDGLGILYERFDKLKRELEIEGLFDQSRKKAIPAYPRKVGIVTASTGAAIQDIVNIARRRNPYVQLILYPALVQGSGAAQSIVKGIKTLDQMNVDTIIVGRGGGSIEDLWAFNEEIVARAIDQCKTAIISAVGHETDFTIADYVADLRAPTPSAAAELAINDYMSFVQLLRGYERELYKNLEYNINTQRRELRELKLRLQYASPMYQVAQKRQYLMDMEQKLHNLAKQRVQEKRYRLELYVAKLQGLSPLAKLSKGYGLVVDHKQRPLQSVSEVVPGQKLTISLLDGDIEAIVESVHDKVRSLDQ